ncbi:peptidylprolyl isomerase [Motilimonas pumila]|uniref:Peptidyl-prolyl cis-trans isomerase n=1 Tax=Motilimonas pumila TaxID=2303987 RepID=A0A418YJV0_9GAMM|nr:peptidylprolyl isomerase [Motilimonas pumila]RJG51262.1 peptidylprolyl isomerase A [Motilimonas pumila]
MRIAQLLTLISCLFIGSAMAANPQIKIATNQGDIELELYQDKAPTSVKNFLSYVEKDGFKNTVFHRVIKGFMIQGGGFDIDYQRVATGAPIVNEAKNGLSNDRGTIAMARTAIPDSATRQFFINHKDNPNLNYGRSDGYAVFGKVTKGMDVVDKIANTRTSTNSKLPGMRDIPVEQVVITEISVLPVEEK